jgi:hypothetical protein
MTATLHQRDPAAAMDHSLLAQDRPCLHGIHAVCAEFGRPTMARYLPASAIRDATFCKRGRTLAPIITLVLLAAALRADAKSPPSEQEQALAGPEPTSQPRNPSSSQNSQAAIAERYPYLTRRFRPSGRYLDHGIIEFSAAAGSPERYRLGLAIGIAHHLTLGFAGHWLNGQDRPALVPQAAIRIIQTAPFEFGLSYRGTLFPPPKEIDPEDESTTVEGPVEDLEPLFQKRSHAFLAGFGLVHEWISTGAEVGVVNRRVLATNVASPNAYRFVQQWNTASALYLRVGNRCAGITLQAFYPALEVELRLDLRWPGFSFQPRGCHQLPGKGAR